MALALDVRNVSKRYWQLRERAMLLTSLLPGRHAEKVEHWALRDVSFRVEPGETVGVLGRNGAGKTTLLRLLAGVSRPTDGSVSIRGRVAPLIGVGVGFHPEMSGRENIYVNGMLLGLKRRQIDQRLEQITAFSEIDDFIDTPVKFYSSGMYMRLGFSVAAHVDPDVMLVDEVLAVGDIAFQLKCFERMRELQSNGTTILLVSHSMHAIRLLCPRALLFRRGHLEVDGPAEQAIARHHEILSSEADEEGNEATVVVEDKILLGDAGPTHHPEPGQHVEYHAKLRFNRPVESPQLYFQIHTDQGAVAYSLTSEIGKYWRTFAAGEVATVRIPFEVRLGGGTYRLTLIVFDRNSREVMGQDASGILIYVTPRLGSMGVADLRGSISVDDRSLSQHESLLIGPSGPAETHDTPDGDRL